MPLPKAPTKLASVLTEIPKITKTKNKPKVSGFKAVPDVPRTAPELAPRVQAASTALPVKGKAPRQAPAVQAPGAASSAATRSAPARTEAKKAVKRIETSLRRLFVLDTNVLMHDPTSLFRFEEHDVYIPLITLEELDDHKKGMSEVARNARQISRTLDSLLEDQARIEDGIPLDKLGNVEATGSLFLQMSPLGQDLSDRLPMGKADNQILNVVHALSKAHAPRNVALVSKDINMRIKARALGLQAEDYFNDQVLEDLDLLYSGYMQLPADFWDKHSKGMESWQQAGATFYRVSGPSVAHMMVNQFVHCDAGIPLIAQVKEITGRTAVLQTLRDFGHSKNAVWGVTARNMEQNFALNLLMNPECDFVSLLGQAGTGKTLLALAAGISQTLESKQYSEIIVTRATVPVGEDIGFLPGTEEEKMAPWMGALEDNLEVLNRSENSAGEWGRTATQDLLKAKIRIKSMNFMRGRTFVNKFLIIDEAQNLSPKQMKTLVTRAGPGTKVICLGNIAQIDTPYLTEGSSGLTYVVDRFKGWPHAGHVTLQRGERSRLADFAADAL
jgi:PhoH-like ATPase